DLAQRPHAVLVDLHRPPEDLLGDDLEHASRPGELGPDLGQAGHGPSPSSLTLPSAGAYAPERGPCAFADGPCPARRRRVVQRKAAATSSMKVSIAASLASPSPRVASGTISSSRPASA